MLKCIYKIGFAVLLLLLINNKCSAQSNAHVLNLNNLKRYVNYFNSIDTEAVKNYVPNAQSFDWLSKNIPLFECPDTTLQQMYYYRWWSFRKHLVQTPDGFVFTEFIIPVKFAGVYNTISSAVGHQVNEGRWLHNQQYIQDYISFWLYTVPKQTKNHFHNFSSWIDDAVYNRYLVNLDKPFIRHILPALDADYHQWEIEKQLPNQMFWQFDVRDAMEESISGSRKDKNIRPTINSYMYGNARALASMGQIAGVDSLKNKYTQKAVLLKSLVQKTLWDNDASFFKVEFAKGGLSDAREAIGFIPWYFNLPDDQPKYAKAWDQLIDTAGFNAPWGLTTAERRHPKFRTHGVGKCEWDGAIWPYATTQDLKSLANLLTNYKNHGKMNAHVFYDALHKYAWSQQMNGHPYIGEYQDEKTGKWLKGDNPRSTFYNHSGFADLVINDLVGLKPRLDNVLEIDPLIPQNQWDWFCLDDVSYHGHSITILWDKTGSKYHKGKGLHVYADGKQILQSNLLKHVYAKLP
ncbi:MGH1-like glycoside hydrolase domain-containing protein [Mucilaginibacter paludis]|uniref:Glycoside hydrolase family 37 n=1 Tax=Mucilaginibacter paludis DSM 18603 TaxID=714943 RepID=H1Y1F8_9SPHI|nr:glycosyl hydrolase family 65 protein [Mucilaginibacter paludis]EHQ30832.1 hypothetical protein Mucpa_6783 [Mucilaginibacter paludis DSM 18603]